MNREQEEENSVKLSCLFSQFIVIQMFSPCNVTGNLGAPATFKFASYSNSITQVSTFVCVT